MSASPSPSPSVSVSPEASPVVVQSLISTPSPTPSAGPSLGSQLTHVDPLVYAALVGAIVIPVLHNQIKKFVSFLNDPKHRTTNYFIAGVLNLIVGYAADLQNSGTLSHLHNPALGGLLATGLSYFLGQNVYGYFVKTNEELHKAQATPGDGLPRTTTP